MELATSVTQSAPLTIKATLTGIRRLREATPLPDDHDLIKMCFGSNDFKPELLRRTLTKVLLELAEHQVKHPRHEGALYDNA